MKARFSAPHRAQRELLASSRLFAGLPPVLIDALAGASRLLEFAAEQSLYRAGDPIHEALLLFTGSVKRTSAMPGGTSRLLELSQTPQVLGLGELFAATHYASSCAAVSAGLIVAVDLGVLRETILRSRQLSERIIQALAARQYAIEFDATGYHYGLTGTQRVLDYLLELAGEQAGLAGETTVELKTSKKLIAARIGMTPESFSRHLRELSDTGVIVVEGRKVHIQNAALVDPGGSDASRRLSFSRKRKGEAGSGARRLASGALVNRCGRLRVLSQRMAIAWWLGAAAIAPLKAKTKLRQLDKEFERTLGVLGQQQLPAELGGRLQRILAVWPDYRAALAEENPPPAAAAGRLFELSEEMLAATDALTGGAAELAGIPAAHHVNVAGRNRMLSQRIVKFFLFQSWPELSEAISPLLAPSCSEFDANLGELQHSGDALPELAAQLQIVAGQWQKLVRAMCPDLANASLARHSRAVLGEGERLLRHLDTTVKLFERLSAKPAA